MRDGRKIRSTFPTKAAALAWRRDGLSAVQNGRMRAPTGQTLREAASAWQTRLQSTRRQGSRSRPHAEPVTESLRLMSAHGCWLRCH